MFRLVPELVRKAVARWRDLTGPFVGAEWESTVEQEVATGWDDHANSEWEPSTEQEAATSWDSHNGPLPAEAHVVRGTDKRDSGYASFGDAPSKPLREGPPFSDSTSAIKYLQLPFRQKYYLLAYVQRTLEATCLRYARANLRGCLTDPEWKKKNLEFSSKEYLPDRLVGRDWLAEDEIELESWMQMFASRVSMPKSKRIFESVLDLRNAAVHRGDREELGFEELSYAMGFPKLLGDLKGDLEITNAFRYVMDDPTLSEGTRARVEEAMYAPQPCTTHYQVLGRIQAMLEETCFNHAARKIPDVLTENGWAVPEQIELQNWHPIFQKADIRHDDSATDLFPDIDPRTLLDLLWGARLHIRNVLAHRLPLTDEILVGQVHRAITICILQGDWDQAIEIEILAETYFAKSSRPQVLKRLEHVYRNGRIDSPYERGRRIALAGFVVRAERREVGEGDALVLTDTFDVGGPSFGVQGAERTVSPSMHESLKKRETLWDGTLEDLGGELVG
ncbi:MAG: hypothetical protein ALECFALPRED_009964 [Alectoria fallacina]|uniref:Uncharacterized protein n=1 Tax=Alectoria fallacina TaxID=1903189 RepID=A0A8H3EX05_9LECA|nr:MAG: hypothetical protein ALECFALPRED_009964 [Alectoria fallacina]